jgi:hypothetical protein
VRQPLITGGRELERASWGRYFDSLSAELLNSETSIEVVDVLRHVVDHPVRIEVDSPGTLAPTKIVIEDDRGSRTLITIARPSAFTG